MKKLELREIIGYLSPIWCLAVIFVLAIIIRLTVLTIDRVIFSYLWLHWLPELTAYLFAGFWLGSLGLKRIIPNVDKNITVIWIVLIYVQSFFLASSNIQYMVLIGSPFVGFLLLGYLIAYIKQLKKVYSLKKS